MSLAYHGNYCGPGWSGGKYQRSIRKGKGLAPTDQFDATCQDHDHAYASGGDLRSADLNFYKQNIGKGIKRSIAAAMVGTQALFRKKTMTTPNKRKNYYASPPATKRRYAARRTKWTQTIPISSSSVATQSGAETKLQRSSGGGGYKQSGYKKRKYKRKYRKTRKTRKKRFVANIGVSFVSERGAVLTGGDCSYLACGTPSYEMFIQIFRAIYHKLLQKAGIALINWEDVIGYAGSIEIEFQNKDRQRVGVTVDDYGIAKAEYVFTADRTHSIVSQQFGQGFHDYVWADTTITNWDDFKFLEAKLIKSNTPLASLNLQTCKFTIDETTKVRFQNQTASDAGAADTEVNNSNPLMIKCYRTSNVGPELYSNIKGNLDNDVAGVLSNSSFMPNYATGFNYYIRSDASGANPGTPNELKKLPAAKTFKGSKASPLMSLAPGNYMIQSHRTTRTIKLDEVFNKFGESMFEPPAIYQKTHKMGQTLIIGMEKALNTYQTTETLNTIGWNSEYHLKISISYMKMRAPPRIVFNA